MIAKTSRSMLALYSGIATFLILVFVLFTYLFATGQKNWWLQLFQESRFLFFYHLHKKDY
jgi:NarL family two-component system sensor histidine kinase LiaS